MDVIITASTAGGKTEAAFLPIISHVLRNNSLGFAALCISPLKALINDQAIRLEGMLKNTGINLCPWHGDIPVNVKANIVKSPSNAIIIITTEALEAMLIHKSNILHSIFQDLQFIVIDEFHAFLSNERGKQLQSLISRVEKYSNKSICKVALSATIGNIAYAKYCLNGGGDVVHIEGTERKSKKVKVSTFLLNDEDSEDYCVRLIAEDIFKNFRGSKNLIFTNRRNDVEQYTCLLADLSNDYKVPNEFAAHHGNLSKEVRLYSEKILKDSQMPATIIATSTLEMGIDVGSIKQIGQIGVPHSVSGLAQRIGRSGRGQDEPSILRCYITEKKLDEKSDIVTRLHMGLVQTVAAINLLSRNFYEEQNSNGLHLSTLVQQVLSFVAQQGGEKAEIIFQNICTNGAFANVSQALFISTLKDLKRHGLIKQDSSNFIVLDKSGEKLVNNYDFYSAFTSSDDYAAVYNTHTIGYLPVGSLKVDDPIILAGKRWLIVGVDDKAKIITLQKTKKTLSAVFGGEPIPISNELAKEMFRVYCSDEGYPYLDKTSQEILQEARYWFNFYKLTHQRIISTGLDVIIFPWTGSCIVDTMALMLNSFDLKVTTGSLFMTTPNTTTLEVNTTISKVLNSKQDDLIFNAENLAMQVEHKTLEKHDKYLSEATLCQNYARKYLDVQSACDVYRNIIASTHK